DYPARGEMLLLQRSEIEEQEKRFDAALSAANILLALAPRSGAAHDRLAQLHNRLGSLDEAADLLQSWHALEPDNALPLVRLAVLASATGHGDVTGARFHCRAAVCKRAAVDHGCALETCQRSGADPVFTTESTYLAGWAHIYRQDPKAASEAFRKVAKAKDSP